MGLETVNVAIQDDGVSPGPVDGVVVRVFDGTGALVTSATSGELIPGVVQLELPGDLVPIEYQLRFYVSGGAISAKRIEVFSPPLLAPTGTNDFEVTAEIFALDPAVDPRKCRCSGFLYGPAGLPRAGADVVFTPIFNSFVIGAGVVLPGRFIVRTDKHGFVRVDLFRFAMYEVTIEGAEVITRSIEVPDRSAAMLAHMLFPVVNVVDYGVALPLALAGGEERELFPAVRTTDFRKLGVGAADVLYTIMDTSVASVQLLSDRIVVRGITPGTTTLRVSRLDSSAVYYPDPGIDGGSVPVVVT